MARLARAEVEAALAAARPELAKHGGDVRLIGVNDQGVVLVELMGACSGCQFAGATLRNVVEKALRERLPEVLRVEAML